MLRYIANIMITAAFIHATVAYAADEPHYTIGTGSVGATYYPIGKAICDVVNHNNAGFTCEAVSTEGSVYNLKALRDGTHHSAISQGTMQSDAYHGQGVFADAGPNETLRTVLPLHVETMILAVQGDADIQSFEDLRNKRVNIGNIGSGTRVILEQLLVARHMHDQMELMGYKSSELPEKFCNNTIDAAIYSTGHPNAIYEQMITQCGVQLRTLWDEKIAEFLEENPQFVRANIPAATYTGQPEALVGFGIPTVLTTTASMPEEHVATLVQLVTMHRALLETAHPVFRSTTLLPSGQSNGAPYHKGAAVN